MRFLNQPCWCACKPRSNPSLWRNRCRMSCEPSRRWSGDKRRSYARGFWWSKSSSACSKSSNVCNESRNRIKPIMPWRCRWWISTTRRSIGTRLLTLWNGITGTLLVLRLKFDRNSGCACYWSTRATLIWGWTMMVARRTRVSNSLSRS